VERLHILVSQRPERAYESAMDLGLGERAVQRFDDGRPELEYVLGKGRN